ncbi:aKG-HExxH-type peptide beta-hydroxylase [Primorskyibacter sp. 2E107]|uniref:aKG-HExxH-type peptide beta-hydroxylase n=1 Tax=Primorskyibacter sp. 2E107 TaxID=3403458 RepID=UPI003AF51066
MTLYPALRGLDATKADLRDRLYTSLHHLIFEAGQGIAPDTVTQDLVSGLTREARPYPAPVVFAAHAALLKAAQAKDEAGFAAACNDLLEAAPAGTAAPERPAVLRFGAPDLSRTGLRLLRPAFQDDVGLMTDLDAPDHETAEAAETALMQALGGLRAAAPTWHADLCGLVSQLLLAVPGPTSAGHFGGASSFDAFGALLFNAQSLTSPEQALMGLVHEAAHLRLFLYHLADPVLLNDSEARYCSPLRREPRPMEGIFHAAWVSARMVAAAQAVRASAQAPDWSEALLPLESGARQAFGDCLPVLQSDAQFTPFGQTLFHDAREALNAG